MPALLAGLLAVPAVAQVAQPVAAVTADGRHILVFPDGTWTLDESPPDEIVLDLNDPPPPAPPPPAALRTIESASGAYTLRYDPTRWQAPRASLNPESEFELTLPFGAGYAVTIFEAFPATPGLLRDVVFMNIRDGLGKSPVLLSEKPLAGGAGLRLEYEVQTEPGLELTFLTSVYGTDAGALQVLTWTPAAAYDQHRDELLRFHDGVVWHDVDG